MSTKIHLADPFDIFEGVKAIELIKKWDFKIQASFEGYSSLINFDFSEQGIQPERECSREQN